MRIEVEVPDESGLARVVWEFSADIRLGLDGLRIRFDRYVVQERPSRRHGWRTEAVWAQSYRREANGGPPFDKRIPKQPEVPKQIREQATAAVIESIVWVES